MTAPANRRVMLSLSAPLAVTVLAVALTATLNAQQHGVVVDQTALPLPGARVELHRGDQIVASAVTGLDGGFELAEAETLSRSPSGRSIMISHPVYS